MRKLNVVYKNSSKALFNHIKYLVWKGRKCIRKEVEIMDDRERMIKDVEGAKR